jgi:hypothetical protein
VRSGDGTFAGLRPAALLSGPSRVAGSLRVLRPTTGLCLRSNHGAEQLLNIGDEGLRTIGFGRYGGYANSQRFAG